jgi:catechol 2,3-dioxygenase-like lactoylglutathione lyase family enzyme
MPVHLNHTIVASRDKAAGAGFISGILGLPPPTPFGPFMVVELDNAISLDYDDRQAVTPAHYAFLVSETEFDEIFARVTSRGITYYADPGHHEPGRISTWRGRGFYFSDPDGHNMEVITRPYTD